MKTRGIVYLVWGNYPKGELQRSIESVEKHGYKYQVVDVTGLSGTHYDKRVHLHRLSPFEVTLHLDTDTKIMGNIDYGFDMAEKHGMALSMAPASNAYHAAGMPEKLKEKAPKDLPQYNCGVMFYDKEKTAEVFEHWSHLMRTYPKDAAHNDQPTLAYTIWERGFNPYVLPKNWNYRPHLRYTGEIFGDIKILHSNKDV